jgi:hypothetical protein
VVVVVVIVVVVVVLLSFEEREILRLRLVNFIILFDDSKEVNY